MNASQFHYNRAAEITRDLDRWSPEPLPAEAYENMGAFGSNTMAFEQWIQFILLPCIHGIIEEQGQFPNGSMLGTYAMRVFDGDHDAQLLHNLLSMTLTGLSMKSTSRRKLWKRSPSRKLNLRMAM